MKSYYALCQGMPKFLTSKVSIEGTFDDVITGLIRSNIDWDIYDHIMHNPLNNYISPKMETLLKKFKDENKAKLKGIWITFSWSHL